MRGWDWALPALTSHNSYLRVGILEKLTFFDPKECLESVWVKVGEQLTWEGSLFRNDHMGLPIPGLSSRTVQVTIFMRSFMGTLGKISTPLLIFHITALVFSIFFTLSYMLYISLPCLTFCLCSPLDGKLLEGRDCPPILKEGLSKYLLNKWQYSKLDIWGDIFKGVYQLIFIGAWLPD